MCECSAELARIAQALEDHTPLLARIAVSNEGQWDCCRHGAQRAEALIEVTMNHPTDPPPENWQRYDAIVGTPPSGA